MSKKTKQFTLAVQIAGSINKSFNSSLTGASTQLSGFQKKVNKLNTTFNTLDKGYDKIMTAGKAAFNVVTSAAVVATAAVTAVSAAAITVGKEFETAFAGVKKTVEATEAEYAQLKNDIIEMSQAIPSSAVEIAGVMEIAGQLGIATANLSKFTETMINLGVSTNLSATDAATALAKFSNITQMDPSNYERLGSTIVDLGNNFATTEADIVEMATRLAATGELVGLTEAQILALSTAMSSVGIASESGGSTMSKLLKKMQIAVETNSESLEMWAEVANMSTTEFSKAFKDDAVVALSAFLSGLDDTERLGKSAVVVLDEMGLTEVRLSNTILSLTNAGDVMTEAIKRANNAWSENTALAIEAGKRYETTDSKIQLMKNSFVALGIAAYEDLQEPFRDVIDSITEWVQDFTEYASGPSGISKWISNISTKVPTAIRKVKGAISDFAEFFSPVISAAKWLWDNPDCLATAFVALGAALATYKIASTLTHIVAGITALAANPVMLGIMAVVGAVGLLAGAMYNAKKKSENLVKAKLDEHFGDIALSLEEIEEVANHLINSDGVLTKLHEAISAFDDLDTMQDSIDNAMRTINKINWKVSIGMELSDDDEADYREAIASYVSDVQDYATQQQYALTLAVNLAYDKDDEMGISILDSINQFYTDNLTELQELGTKLNKAISDAFTDGLLEIDEAKEIQELMQQISDIQSQLAKSNFDAALTSLALDYDIGSGAQLDADTFQNLQAAVNEQLAAFEAENKESRDKLIQNAALRLSQGYITQAQYDAEVASIAEQYAALYDEKVAAAMEFMTKSIMDSNIIQEGYAEMYKAANAAFKDGLTGDLLGDDVSNMDSWGVYSLLMHGYENAAIEMVKVGSTYSEAVEKLLEQLTPTYDYLLEQKDYYESLGTDIPEYITQGISDYEAIEALKNATGAVPQIVYGVLSDSGNLEIIEQKLTEYGSSIDEILADAITGNKTVVSDAVQEVLDEVAKLKSIEISPTAFKYNAVTKGMGLSLDDHLGLGLPGHADGGIFTVPHIAAFAEEGPEAAIPLDGSTNAISLWERTGKLLGMGSVLDGVELGGGSGTSIEYKPTLVFKGGTPDQSDIEAALDTSYEKFESMMDRYMRERRRVAF